MRFRLKRLRLKLLTTTRVLQRERPRTLLNKVRDLMS
jgi:hypothetical protein